MQVNVPMDEAQLVHRLDGQRDLSHVKARDVFGEDLVLDEHGHEIAARQELHEHVEERGVLEGRVQLHQPRAVGIGENVTLGTYVRQLILLVLSRPVSPNTATKMLRADRSIFTISALISDLSA